jgi:hypothetical protein
MFMDAPYMQNINEYTIYDIHSAVLLGPFARCRHIAHVTVICRNSLDSSEIPALLDSWVTNTPSVKLYCPQKGVTHCIFLKTQHD